MYIRHIISHYLLVLRLCVASGANDSLFRKGTRHITSAPKNFKQISRAKPTKVHQLVFALKQSGKIEMEELLAEISDLSSPSYGKHLTRAQVAEMSMDPKSTLHILDFLKTEDVHVVEWTKYGEYIVASAPIAKWESLLDAKFHEYEFRTRETISRTLEFTVPFEIDAHVHAIIGALDFPPPIKARNGVKTASVNFANLTGGFVSPLVLNSVYNITSNNATGTTQLIYAANEETFSPSDLVGFENTFGIEHSPVTTVINGHSNDTFCVLYPDSCGEASLDVQYLTSTARGARTTFYYNSGAYGLFSWIYDVANMTSPPLVHSISYGSDESLIKVFLMELFDMEALKLSLQGVTIIASSGDDGAFGDGVSCTLIGAFPVSSIYVTAVGATMGPESGRAEVTCQADLGSAITSGGGFSLYSPMPSWQTAAVGEYFAKFPDQLPGIYPSGTFPGSAPGRMYPDVSLLGHGYVVVIGGAYNDVDGTSASAPVFAGMVSLVNAARIRKGLSPLGWLNPTIYTYGGNFTRDITSGDNYCRRHNSTYCCNSGFEATAGWDPVTGFGSIDFSKFMNFFMSYPGAYPPTSKPTPGVQSTGSTTMTDNGTGAALGVLLPLLLIVIGCLLYFGGFCKSCDCFDNSRIRLGDEQGEKSRFGNVY